MIKVENSTVMIGAHSSDEIKKDYMEIVRAICLYYRRDENLSDEEAKQKVRDLTEEALKFKVADPGHMKAPDLVAQILRDIFEGGPSCT